MELKLRPGRSEDVTDFVRTFFDGFADHATSKQIFIAGTQPAWDFWYNSLSEEIQDPKARFLVVEDVSTTPPAFVGFAKWNRLPATDEPQEPLGDGWPRNGDVALARRFFGLLHEKHGEFMGGRQHWYLELVATKKAYQGKGAGAMMVRWGVARADEEGWEAYLDATPQGKGLYERVGFKTVYSYDFSDIAYTHVFMVREAKR